MNTLRVRNAQVFLCITLLLYVASPTLGQSSSLIEAWLDAAIQSSYELIYPYPDFDGGGLSWTRERFVEGAALRRLQVDLDGKPDHPDRGLLERSVRRARGKFAGSTYRLWSDGLDRWRISQDFYDQGHEHYWDAAYMPKRQWSLTRQHLDIFEPGKIPHQSADVKSQGNPGKTDLSLLLTGSLAAIRNADMTVGPVQVGGNGQFQFKAILETPDGDNGFAMQFQGRWDDAHHRGFIASALILQNTSNARAVGQMYEFKDWRFLSDLQVWCATVVTETHPDRDIVSELRFVETLPGSLERLDALTAIPQVNGNDAIRDQLEFTTLTDHRRNSIAVISPDGLETSRQIATSAPDAGASIRWIGWALLFAAAVGGVVLIRKKLVS